MHWNHHDGVILAKPPHARERLDTVVRARRVVPSERTRSVEQTPEDVDAVRQARQRIHPRRHARVVERRRDRRDPQNGGRRSAPPLAGELERDATASREAEHEDSRDARVVCEAAHYEVEVARETRVVERRSVDDALAGSAHVETDHVVARTMQRDACTHAAM